MEDIFPDLKEAGDNQAISFSDFIDKAQKIKLSNSVHATADSEYTVGSLKYFQAECPSLGKFNNRDHFANLKKRFIDAINKSNSDFDYQEFDDVLNDKLSAWPEENPEYGDSGFFGAAGIDASAKAFSIFLSLLYEKGYLNDEDLREGKIIAIQRAPQRSYENRDDYTNPEIIYTDKRTDALQKYLNIIYEGVAGSGKSYVLGKLRASNVYGYSGNRIEVVVFHPSTSYEEFVSGIRPNFNKKPGEGDFLTQEGTFIQICNRAAEDPNNPYLLFIDEINRANTSRVFGDLMLVLEKSKRQDFKDLPVENRDGALFEADFQQMPGEYVRLQTPIFKNGKEYNKLAVPSNLHVLGTMNTTDRSVGTIDLALRRRFHWATQHPYSAEELKEAMEEAKETYPDSIANWYENTNKILLDKVGPDARLGHAYFFGKEGDEDAIAEALLNQLKEVAFTFNISEDILEEIGSVGGQRIITRGSGLGARPDIVAAESD